MSLGRPSATWMPQVRSRIVQNPQDDDLNPYFKHLSPGAPMAAPKPATSMDWLGATVTLPSKGRVLKDSLHTGSILHIKSNDDSEDSEIL